MIGNYFCKKKNQKKKKSLAAPPPKKKLSSEKQIIWQVHVHQAKRDRRDAIDDYTENSGKAQRTSCLRLCRCDTDQCETVRELKKIAIHYANNSYFFTQAHEDEIILLWIEQTITVIEIRQKSRCPLNR